MKGQHQHRIGIAAHHALRMTCVLGVILVATHSAAQLPAFPGAEGFGAHAAGGRGGDVYHVVNLNSSGPDSLAEGIASAPAGGRTIVFSVSGYIHVPGSNLRIVQDNMTIAGQTAPGDGIGLKDGTLRITGNNAVIRFLRIRHGKNGGGGDCLNVDSSAVNTIIDHVSMQFSTDENISFFNRTLDDFTMQWSVSAWGLESHNAGGLWDLEDGTCHHSLWAHHHTRNPKARPYGLLEWINNVTFDWGIGFIMGDSTTPADWKANVQGSTFLSPPTYTDSIALEKARIDRNGNPNFGIHLDDCLHDDDGDGILNGTDKGYAIVAGSEFVAGEFVPPESGEGQNRYVKSATPFPGSSTAVTMDDPLTAYKKVVSQVGVVRLDATYAGPVRDEVETVLIDNVVQQQHSRIASEAELAAPPFNVSNGGFGTLNATVAPADSDLDGMPDYWELSTGSDHTVANHNDPVPAGAYIPDLPAGYTLLEEYLHFLAVPHATIAKNTAMDPSSLAVDLRRFTSGFGTAPVVFAVANSINGTATMQPDGYTVVFEPTVDFSGRAQFEFSVQDGDGSTWAQVLMVMVSTVGLPDDLLWQGDGAANLWDSVTTNFLDGVNPATFDFGDNVRFDDAGSLAPAVQVVGTLSPGVVEVDTDWTCTFGGGGTLAGGMSLAKTGGGTLTLGNAGPNSYGGGTTISEGTITLAAAGGLGTGAVAMENASTLQLGTLSLQPGNALTIAGSPTISGGNGGGLTDIHAVSGSGTLNIVPTSVFDLEGDVSGFNGTLRFSGNQTVRMNGSTGGSSVAFDLGDGSLTLNKRTTTGSIILGALSGGPNTTLQGASGSGNTSATTYIIGGKDLDTTFQGTIVDGQGVTGIQKTGSGALNLTGNHAHTGLTTIDEGILLINGHNGPGNVDVNGGTLGGTGTVGGILTVNSAGRCAPGTDVGTLTIAGDLVLNTPTLLFDLGGAPTGGNDQVLMQGGLLDMNGTQTFQFNLVDGVLTPGTYWLIDGAGNSDAAGVALVHNLPPGGRQTFSLERPASGTGVGYVRLVITGDPAALTWQGNLGTGWDLVTSNWLNGAMTDRYFNFDRVRFDDSAATGNVDISGALQPLSVTVSNDVRAYTFSGGALDGPMQLVKTGPGTLTVNNTFAHTGGTLVEGGTVILTANDGLGLNPVTLRGGALAAVSGDFLVPLVVEGEGTFIASATPHTYVKAPISGSGVLTVVPSGNIWTYEDDFAGFSGSIVLSGGGSLRLNQGAYVWGNPNCTFDLGNAATLNNRATTGAATVFLGALEGESGSTLMASQQAIGTGLVDTYVVGDANLDTSFAGSIVDGPNHALALSKVGSGTLTLSGNSTFSGGTEILNGTLEAENGAGSATGTGPVNVHAGATLSGDGSVGGTTTLADGARLQPGGSVGTLTLEDGLALSEFSQLCFDLGATSDQVVVSGDLFVAGELTVTDSGGFGPGVYTLFNYDPADSLTLGTISFGMVPGGHAYVIDASVAGEVRLIVSSTNPVGFGSFTLAQGELVARGENGVPLGEFFVLGTTNLILPLPLWDRLSTNLFDPGGAFSLTNAVQPGVDLYFFGIETP